MKCTVLYKREMESLEQILYIGTFNGEALWFSNSNVISHNVEHARLLAGIVNLNEKNRNCFADEEHNWNWMELQMRDNLFVIYPLVINCYGMFLAISTNIAQNYAKKTSRLKIIHIASMLLSRIRPEVGNLLKWLHHRAREHAHDESFNNIISGSTSEDFLGFLAAGDGQDTLRYGDEDIILRKLETFEVDLVHKVMTQGEDLYAYMFEPVSSQLGELSRCLASDWRPGGHAECQFRLFLREEQRHGNVSEAYPDVNADIKYYPVSIAYSSGDIDTNEFTAAASAYARHERLGWVGENIGRTRVLLVAQNAEDSRPVAASMVISSCGSNNCFVLVLAVPPSLCQTDGHEPLHASVAKELVQAWPLLVLPAWLVDAWQETIRRIDEIFAADITIAANSSLDSDRLIYAASCAGALHARAGVAAIPLPLDASPRTTVALQTPHSPATPTGALAVLTKEDQLQTPMRVPAPPSQPKPQASANDSDRKARPGRALRPLR